MVLLNCVIVGEGSLVPVRTKHWKTVGELQEAIEQKSEAVAVSAQKMQLVLAKTEGGAWLLESELAARDLEDGRVGRRQDGGSGVKADPIRKRLQTELRPHPRKRRWDQLNAVLDKSKKAKNGSTALSYAVSCAEINRAMPVVDYEQPSKLISDDKLAPLYGYFPVLVKAYGHVKLGNEATRLHFTLPVLATVCALFDGDAHLVTNEAVTGMRFEFLLRRGGVCVGVVAAKRGEGAFELGLAQAAVGSEALVDLEGQEKVYTIVTNFVDWIFTSSLDEKIERTSPESIELENGVPTPASVKRIAEMIYAILSDEVDDEFGE